MNILVSELELRILYRIRGMHANNLKIHVYRENYHKILSLGSTIIDTKTIACGQRRERGAMLENIRSKQIDLQSVWSESVRQSQCSQENYITCRVVAVPEIQLGNPGGHKREGSAGNKSFSSSHSVWSRCQASEGDGEVL